ncbi:hypothetical protein SAMN05660662_3404 [Blastococcus aurantiacus]|uniref:Homeodomain-like domain-containing protein n=1 Tax=Blastococcus aurantiacus TaxID=1550231 RepID=A0A1G7P1M2_9ACTN|nr:hypothetical protein [Blastococcus aurantiacus]SDF80131.1 hypothetical protein SAMN05660662_3404 [Blastococcus aurantiacus]
MVSPDELDTQVTLRTAVARYEQLRALDSLAEAPLEVDEALAAPSGALSQGQALELLALSEVIFRKAAYGRQLTVRAARRAGASWSAIGQALGTTKQAAWEAHTRWIDDQSEQHEDTGHAGLSELEVARARRFAGRPEDRS